MMTQAAVESKIFYIPTKIIHGPGTSSCLAGEMNTRNLKSALLVTDKGVREAGVTRSVEECLSREGIGYSVFDEVEIDPSISCVHKGADIVTREKHDSIVVVGGGSPICAAKGIAVLATNGGSIKDYEGLNKGAVPPLPVFALPTTAGSGSEVSPVFLIKDYENDRKMSCKGRYHPVVAILDPLLLLTLPYWQAVCSSLDAMTHAVDACFSIQATEITDALAIESFRIMWQHLFPAAATRSIESREKMLLASSMANFACGNAGLALIHGATYGLHTLAHGYACGLTMPFAMEYNLPVAVGKMAKLAQAMEVDSTGLSQKDLAYEALSRMKMLYTELGFPNRLTESEVPRESIPELVDLTMRSHMITLNVRRPTTKDMTSFFENLFTGWEI